MQILYIVKQQGHRFWKNLCHQMIYILYIVWNNSDIKLDCDKNLCQSSSDCKKLIIKYMYSVVNLLVIKISLSLFAFKLNWATLICWHYCSIHSCTCTLCMYSTCWHFVWSFMYVKRTIHTQKLCACFIVFAHLKDCLKKDYDKLLYLSATLSARCRVYLQLHVF